jgi:16S rRNA (cytosine967-C5)-methyltransferase
VNPRVLSFAEQVVRKVDRDHPADSVLRSELKSQRVLSGTEPGEVTHAVFCFFRWLGWLDPELRPRDQILHACELSKRFAKRPESFSDAELVSRVVPFWVQKEIDVTPGFARAIQSEPDLWLRAHQGKGPPLARKLQDCRVFGSGPLANTLAYLGRKDLFRTAEFHAGDFEVQDISSQAVGLVCGPRPGETWWDACAGEGGKLLHLSDLMKNKGLIWASDRAEWRLRRLKRRAARAQVFNYRTAIWDGGPKLPTRTKFDGILLDAPCSGTGTWQRNPHARWTLRMKDIEELRDLQLRLLVNCAPALKPSGKLVYSVCSLTRTETSEVAQAFERSRPDFRPLIMENPLAVDAPPSDRLMLWPQDFAGNGMFIRAWMRKAN